MLDHRIKGATLVDGGGGPARRADVGTRDGRVVALGELGSFEEPAAETIDGAGLVLAPGFVDPHTHYDAQLFWDPCASPSNLHGVTSVIGGNCGFSLAPLGEGELAASNADYPRRMMAVVEGMPLDALTNGLDWSWQSFGDWLERLVGNVAVNAGFLVGHCALRRAVMGEAAVGNEASEAQVLEMVRLLGSSVESGALGLSSSRSFTHRDGDGNPVPSRAASEDELLQLCAELEGHEGTCLEFITDGCLNGFDADEVELMTRMSLRANRPLNWNVFTIDSKQPELYAQQLAASARAAAEGARVVALTMPILVGMTMSFRDYSPIHQLPDWRPILSLPLEERMRSLRDPAVRAHMEARAASKDAGVFARVADWPNFKIGETHSQANAGLSGRLVRDIAAERGQSAFDTLLDIVLEDELRTILWPQPPDDDAASWEMRRLAWDNEHTLLGGSDAGAHLDRMCGAPYPTAFLADCLRGRKLMTMERAIQAMTDAPARLFGLKDRGRIALGSHADLVLFDPERIDAGEVVIANDLPGASSRLVADSIGVERVFVNGRVTVSEGVATGDLPGTILRSGRDTQTVSLGRS
jgi:N-acyl-D-aspartate/D-glutamate deacylase